MTDLSQESDKTSSTGRVITTHFVPRWPGNPYHAELADHLLEYGVRVDDEYSLKNISREIHASGRKPEIVHIQAIPRFDCSPMQVLRSFMFCFRLFRLRILGVRLVWTIHDISHHEVRHPRVELAISRWIFRRADALIVHSNAARKAVERQWRVTCDGRLSVIPHGNYIGSYPNHGDRNLARGKLGVSPDKLVILFLGMIRPYKGVLELIEVFKDRSFADLELVIAGQPLSEELSEEIRTAIGSHGGIHYFPGFMGDEEMQDYFNAADVVVFPYTKALTSGALILAMSFGRACIAPRMGALEDTLDDEGGFLYDPAAPDALRNALSSAVSARSRLEAMGKHNYRKAEGWPWSETARMTADVYRGCLAKQQS